MSPIKIMWGLRMMFISLYMYLTQETSVFKQHTFSEHEERSLVASRRSHSTPLIWWSAAEEQMWDRREDSAPSWASAAFRAQTYSAARKHGNKLHLFEWLIKPSNHGKTSGRHRTQTSNGKDISAVLLLSLRGGSWGLQHLNKLSWLPQTMEGCGPKHPLQKKKISSHLQEIGDISLVPTCLQQGICLWLCSERNFLLFLSLSPAP